jgi:hypothetical protein
MKKYENGVGGKSNNYIPSDLIKFRNGECPGIGRRYFECMSNWTFYAAW